MSKSPEVSPEQVQTQKQIKNTQKNTDTDRKKAITTPKHPPIIVTNVHNYHNIMEIMDSNEVQYNTSKLFSGDIKINVPDGYNYGNMTKALNEKDKTWYSYQDKQTRPIVKKPVLPTRRNKRISTKQIVYNNCS